MPSASSTASALDSVAHQVLAEFPGLEQPTRCESLQSGGGFSGARLWRVDVPSRSFCLRAMRCDRVNMNRLSGLHRLLAHVHSCGVIQVAAPLRCREGTTHVATPGWVWQVEPWMPGHADFASWSSSVRLQDAMTTLARFHQASQSFIAKPAERPWFASSSAATSPGISERSARIDRWDRARCALVGDCLARRDWPAFDALGERIIEVYCCAAPGVANELELGRQVVVPLQPCLRDVWHDHLLFTGDSVTGLIDAHACRADNVATDLARLLGSLVADDRTAWDAGLAAYELLRPLSVAERGLLELFDRSAVLLNGLTWLEWKCLEGRRFERPEAVLGRMEEIVRRMERLVAK